MTGAALGPMDASQPFSPAAKTRAGSKGFSGLADRVLERLSDLPGVQAIKLVAPQASDELEGHVASGSARQLFIGSAMKAFVTSRLAPKAFRGVAALSLAALLASGGAACAQSSPSDEERQLSRDIIHKLDSIISGSIKDEELPGAVVGIWIPGEGRYVAAAGVADLVTHSPRRLDQPFRIASVTKTFVGTVILELADEGRLRTSDPISRWFPGFPQGDETTVDDLLRMRSGIPDTLEQALPLYYSNPLLPVGSDIEVALASLEPLSFSAPDKETVYANINFVLLQRIAEKVTGKPFSELLQSMISTPLGLENTTFPTDPTLPGGLHGYTLVSRTGSFLDTTLSNPNYPNGAGGMISTLADLHRYVRALCGGGLLSPQAQATRLQSQPFQGAPLAGYGQAIVVTGKFCGHNGTQIGFSIETWYDQPSRSVIVISVNRLDADDKSQSEALFGKIAQLLFPNSLPHE